jgi:putative ABC transport system permease protein
VSDLLSEKKSMLVRVAWRNVIRNWRHSLASSLAIASGLIAVSLFDGFLKNIQYVIEDGYTTRAMLGHVVIQKPDAQNKLVEDFWNYTIPANEQQFIEDFLKQDPDVEKRVRFLEVKGLASSERNSAVFIGYGYDTKEGGEVRGEKWEWNVVAGKPLSRAPEGSILVGRAMGLTMDCTTPVKGWPLRLSGGYEPGERPFTCMRPRLQLSTTTEFMQVNALDLPVAGIMDAAFRETDLRFIAMSLKTAQALLDTDKISLVAVTLKSSKDVPAFLTRFNQQASAAGFKFDAMRWQEHNLGAILRGNNQILGVFRGLFLTIVLVIAVMSVANTMMKSVNERVREIGTLRSLGFYRKDINTLFALEGLFLGFCSCFIGVIVTIIASIVISRLGITFKAGLLSEPVFLQVKIVPLNYLLNSLWLIALAAVTAWYCAKRAANMIIADAMRFV